MNKYVISDTGVKVYIDYKDNIIIDKDSKVLETKADKKREEYSRGRVKGLKRFGSENSEDAKTWNLFRTLELKNRINEYYEKLGIKDKTQKVLFWGMDSNTAVFDKELKSVLDEIEPPNLWVQQTEPDVIIIGGETVIFNESKIGAEGNTIDAWNRKNTFEDKHELYKGNAKRYFIDSFIDQFQVEGRRYYQLLRNHIIGKRFADRLGKDFYLVALVSDKNKAKSGLSHKEELDKFISFLKDPTHCHLLTWSQFAKY